MPRRRSLPVVALIVAFAGVSTPIAAGSAPTSAAPVRTIVAAPRANLAAVHLKLELEASGLADPVAIAWKAGDPRMYVAEHLGINVPQMSTFAQGPKGELHAMSHNGRIYLIAAA